jgi:hypothetical protein
MGTFLFSCLVLLPALASMEPSMPPVGPAAHSQGPMAPSAELRTLSDVTEHLAAQGIHLRRDVPHPGAKTEWIVEDENNDSKCEMRTMFITFDRDVSLDVMRRYLMGMSVLAHLNESARVAMVQPWWRGTTSEKDACKVYTASSRSRADLLVIAFLGYTP